ncbi:MAG: phosphopantetheine-binding protein [Chloroflexota bacterium]
MTSDSSLINRIAGEMYDPEQIQQKMSPAAGASSADAPAAGEETPRTPTEKWLAALCAEWLELESIGIHDDFFDLGGDSIMAMRVMARIRDHYQVTLSQTVLFTVDFTVAEIARLIDEQVIEQAHAADIEEMMLRLDELSDDEVQSLLSDL